MEDMGLEAMDLEDMVVIISGKDTDLVAMDI